MKTEHDGTNGTHLRQTALDVSVDLRSGNQLGTSCGLAGDGGETDKRVVPSNCASCSSQANTIFLHTRAGEATARLWIIFNVSLEEINSGRKLTFQDTLAVSSKSTRFEEEILQALSLRQPNVSPPIIAMSTRA